MAKAEELQNTPNPWTENFFQHADIVLLGEAHSKGEDLIISFIEKFSPDLSGVFYEVPCSLQESIDHYYATGDIRDDLKGFLKGSERESHSGEKLLRILTLLKQKNIKVIFIDSSKEQVGEFQHRSERGYYFLKGESRDDDMFHILMDYYRVHPG